MLGSVFARILLIAALLIAQAGSLAHGMTHILPDRMQGSGHSLPHDKFCDQCVAFAQIGGAVGSDTISLAISESNAETLHPDPVVSCTSTTFVAFAARAPPFYS